VSGASTLAPAHRAAEPTRSRATRGWLPGAVLVAGLGIVAAVVATAPDVSVRILGQIQSDGASTHAVGGTYVQGWDSPDFNPFVDDRFRLFTVVAAVVQLVSTAAIGATLIAAIRGVEQWPRLVRVLAGFLPGFLIVLAPMQLLFAGLPVVTASWISLVALPAVAVLLHRPTLTATAVSLRDDRRFRRRWLAGAATLAGILALCALHRLQAGRYFMVPDSISTFLDTAARQVRGGFGGHLAQWDQQNDEWVFNAPLMFYSRGGRDYLLPFYLTEVVSLASFGALLFGVVHSLAWRRRMQAAAVATAVVLAASPSIFPWYQIALIGGQNPVMWLGHPGRMLGIVAPWVALLLLGRHGPRATVAILLASAGLAFTSVNGTAYVLVALAGAGAWTVIRGRGHGIDRGRRVVQALVPALALLALATPVFVYWDLHRTDFPDALGWVLVAGAGAAVLAAVLVAAIATPSSTEHRRPAVLPRAGAWLVALGAGFFVSNNLVGNFAGGQFRTTLASVLPGYGIPLQTHRAITGEQLTSGAADLRFPSFTGQECAISGHCVSFGYFLAGYGVLLVLALATGLALASRSSDDAVGPRRAAWLVTLGAFVCSFALVDFTGVDNLTAWVLTRFIEVPYYALLAFAAVALVGSRSRITAWIGGTVLMAWVVVSLAFSHVAPQLLRNADWFLGVL
jgi:hypothetical protein